MGEAMRHICARLGGTSQGGKLRTFKELPQLKEESLEKVAKSDTATPAVECDGCRSL